MIVEKLLPDFEHSDERGRLIQLVHSGFSQVNFIESRVGTIRGGHWHEHNGEAFYVCLGGFELELADMNTGERESHTFKAGDFFLVKSGVWHRFRFTSDTALVSMYDLGIELENGTKDIKTFSANQERDE